MTIKDLAAQTGYSLGTVSRVLNNQPNVSEKARKVILEAAACGGFQLNTNAKQLRQQRSNAILAVVKGTSNQLFGALLEHLQSHAASMSYPLIVDYLDEDENEVLRGVQLCREKKPQGVLFLGGNRENFRRDFRGIPVPCVLVTNDAEGLEYSNLSSVTSDDRQIGEIAIRHLVELGHRRIAVIGGDRRISDITMLRYEGCENAFRACRLAFDAERDYVSARFSYADGYRAVQTLLSRGREFTALFTMADVMAIGAIRALRDNGLRVPEDVSVIGVDGLVIGQYMVPKLATVYQSVEELARRSLEILRSQIEQNAAVCHETIPVEVICRESVRNLVNGDGSH